MLHQKLNTMEELPPEIIAHILSRLQDFKSIGKCRCVSKLWNTILCESTLTAHLSKTTPDLLLHFKSYNSPGSWMCYVEDDDNNLPIYPLKQFDDGYFMKNLGHRKTCILGSCNGFVCLLTNSIYLFNPITEEHVKLPPLPLPNNHPVLSGFGFDDSNKVFKLVLTFRHEEVRVLTVGTSTWRNKSDLLRMALPFFIAWKSSSSTFNNGSLHWLAQRQRSVIVSFRLDTEEFATVPGPECLEGRSFYCSLGLIEEQLSMVEYFYDSCVNVWVMKKYNVKESWFKQFSIRHRIGKCVTPPHLIKHRKNGELILLLNEMYLIACNTVTQIWRPLPICYPEKSRPALHEIHIIGGSLVSTKKAFGMECDVKKTTSVGRKNNRTRSPVA